jgi:hypothetical protein
MWKRNKTTIKSTRNLFSYREIWTLYHIIFDVYFGNHNIDFGCLLGKRKNQSFETKIYSNIKRLEI